MTDDELKKYDKLFEKARKTLFKLYSLARELPMINDPVARALYETWRLFDVDNPFDAGMHDADEEPRQQVDLIIELKDGRWKIYRGNKYVDMDEIKGWKYIE